MHPDAFRLRIATHPTQWSIEPLRCTAWHVLHCALHAANLSDLHVWEAAAAAAWGASVMPALRRDILAVVHVRPRLLLSVLGVLSHTATSALRRSWHDIPAGARAQLTRAAPRKCCRWAAQWRCGELCLAFLPSRATPVLPRCSPAAHGHPMHCGPGGLPFVMKLVISSAAGRKHHQLPSTRQRVRLRTDFSYLCFCISRSAGADAVAEALCAHALTWETAAIAAALMPFPGTLDSYSGAGWCAPTTSTDECIHIHMRADPAYTINDGDSCVASRGMGLCGSFSDNNDNKNDYTQA